MTFRVRLLWADYMIKSFGLPEDWPKFL
jgi:hypothetical protein